jgi:polyphenol oxidase
MEWHERDGLRWLEADLGAGRAVFTTRTGGTSEAPFDRLNLTELTGDAIEAVGENRHRLATALGLRPERIPIGIQVHGADLAIHHEPQAMAPFLRPGAELPQVDGHVTSQPGLAPLALVADCLPIALSGPGGVAMLHCGWRGLAAGIIAAGTRAIDATAAAIGPGIGACCFEVGPEVAAAFSSLGDGVAAERMLDLPEIARRLLREAGVERVESAALCTSCEEELFFSYRRDGERTGRQAGLAWLGAGEG